jgi:hypothetical protein
MRTNNRGGRQLRKIFLHAWRIEKQGAKWNDRQCSKVFSAALLVACLALTTIYGCGQTEKPSTPATADQVNSYFGGPVTGRFSPSVSTFDHSRNNLGVSALINNLTTQVPSSVLQGTFAPAPTGFMSVTENFAVSASSLYMSPQDPPLTGAWALEIPNGGALANLLKMNPAGSPLALSAAPAIMAENTVCPQFSKVATPYLYVTVPNPNGTVDTADYGGVNVTTQGSAVTFSAQPYQIGPLSQSASTVTGGCSQTIFGPLTAYPLNSFGLTSNIELIAIGDSGLLVSSFVSGNAGTSLGAFGGGTGVVGVSAPSSPVNVSAVVGAQYNGFFYAPQTTATSTYDLTALASAYGDHTSTSQACSTLQSSLAASHGQGADTVSTLPSASSLYGGEFLTTTSTGPVNNPTGALGSENCDVAIDLGEEDGSNNGLFAHATLFIGSNFPPFSASNPWLCTGTSLTCATSFPAAAIVGTVQGKYVILVVASAQTNPAAQLPNNFGSPIAQPLGIYLFQK